MTLSGIVPEYIPRWECDGPILDGIDIGDNPLYDNGRQDHSPQQCVWSLVPNDLLVHNMQGHGDYTNTTKWPSGGECTNDRHDNESGMIVQ